MSDEIPLKNKKIQHWIQRCQKNISDFKKSQSNMPVNEKINFIRSQYHLLYSVRKVIDGKASLNGASIDMYDKNL
jgi:hypothetical protein